MARFARLHRRSVVLSVVQTVVLLVVALRALGASAAAIGEKMPDPSASSTSRSKNVLGEPLRGCSTDPLTGFFRDGCCETGPDDRGRHVVCAEVTAEFLTFTARRGNDLSTPRPELRFPGLRPGDHWCLCALRWREALEAGVAPPVDLAATHENVLDFVALGDLVAHALPADAPPTG